MALPHKVVKVTLSGDMFNGAEVWSTGFYLGSESAASAPITDTAVSDVSAAWETFFKAASSGISSSYKFKMCKLVEIGVDGKTLPDTAKYYSPQTVVSGGSAQPPYPPQIALVATLSNSLPRGLATKGRMFLPGVNFAVDTSGHIATANIEGLATNLKTFFDNMYNDADLPGRPVLMSTGVAIQLRPGAVRNVTQIRVGNVFDTQRRRRNALNESYNIKPVAGG